ncbi:uncharacterized protein LOC101847212 [Aplysia californica]|uniref:Uncharacterized protein LOC101847212 n=1 Tax=Aplysia californica TaxID=6500 RepID=A0ABM0K2C6_APLCA|nr:uncharacterized protein LOC101847212 [Aplysia californica]
MKFAVFLLLLSLAFAGCSAGRRWGMRGGGGRWPCRGFFCRFWGLSRRLPAPWRPSLPVCSGKGTLGERFALNLGINDADNDTFVSGPEIYNDFKNNYDTNNDGCVTEAEWTQRWERGLRFSKAYAVNRFAALASDNVTCPITYESFENSTDMQMPVGIFLSANLQTLVETCQSDNSRLISNCDCLQLLGACVNDAKLSEDSVCKAYVVQPVIATD